MPGGPWYVSARAVRDYAAIAGLGDPDNHDVFARAEDELIRLARETVASGRQGSRLRSGAVAYRVRLPVRQYQPGDVAPHRVRRPGRGSTGRPRVTLIVAETQRPEGPLPQVVAVWPDRR